MNKTDIILLKSNLDALNLNLSIKRQEYNQLVEDYNKERKHYNMILCDYLNSNYNWYLYKDKHKEQIEIIIDSIISKEYCTFYYDCDDNNNTYPTSAIFAIIDGYEKSLYAFLNESNL